MFKHLETGTYYAPEVQTMQNNENHPKPNEQTIQATRRVRVPGLRGRILDRRGRVLAESRASLGIRCDLQSFQRRGAVSNTVAAVEARNERIVPRFADRHRRLLPSTTSA